MNPSPQKTLWRLTNKMETIITIFAAISMTLFGGVLGALIVIVIDELWKDKWE